MTSVAASALPYHPRTSLLLFLLPPLDIQLQILVAVVSDAAASALLHHLQPYFFAVRLDIQSQVLVVVGVAALALPYRPRPSSLLRLLDIQSQALVAAVSAAAASALPHHLRPYIDTLFAFLLDFPCLQHAVKLKTGRVSMGMAGDC